MSCLHVCVHRRCAWCPLRPEEGIGPSETGVTDSSESPCGCWESNLHPLLRPASASHLPATHTAPCLYLNQILCLSRILSPCLRGGPVGSACPGICRRLWSLGEPRSHRDALVESSPNVTELQVPSASSTEHLQPSFFVLRCDYCRQNWDGLPLHSCACVFVCTHVCAWMWTGSLLA